MSGNIHTVRDSQNALIEALAGPDDAVLSSVDDSAWLKHLVSLLRAAKLVAKGLDEGTSILVHCSDGWDRTAQAKAAPGDDVSEDGAPKLRLDGPWSENVADCFKGPLAVVKPIERRHAA
ncbi:Myotubularin-like phosphatase domain-containing protein [Pelagophyceae sp. CCMP2097]|nr:Myotubularin-like phosphatase domain-containing protein [Pelagophyceae sp. CCMP2097]